MRGQIRRCSPPRLIFSAPPSSAFVHFIPLLLISFFPPPSGMFLGSSPHRGRLVWVFLTGQIEVSLLPLLIEDRVGGEEKWGGRGRCRKEGRVQGEGKEDENVQGKNKCRDAGSYHAVFKQD